MFLCKSQKTVLRRRDFFFHFFFKNVLGITLRSRTQNLSQIHYVYLYRRGHPSERPQKVVYKSLSIQKYDRTSFVA